MATPRSQRLTITPISAKPLSISPGSRVLKSPLSDEEIWKGLKEVGFDEESIKQKDKAALVAYIAKLEAEIYDHQHHMGLLILERKELAAKYEQLKALVESSELLHSRDAAGHLSALAEGRKQEESLKKVVEVKDECISSLEKALHEMRAECAETKVAAESKLAEAHRLIDASQRKFTEAETKVHAAESLQAEASRFSCGAERKLKDVEAREDDLRRRIISFKSDCEMKEKEMMLERQSLSERQKGLQQEQDRLIKAQVLLNEREDHIFSRSQELNQLQKELESTKLQLEKGHRGLRDEKAKLELMEATLTGREEALTKRETELNKKEQELLDFQAKLAGREFDETQKVIAGQEAALRIKEAELQSDLLMRCKLVENEIETKKWAWELKEVDLKQQEDQIMEREQELEKLSSALGEKEKDLAEMSSVLEHKDQRLRAAGEELELKKKLLQKEKEEINKTKQDLQRSQDSLESKRRQVDQEKERLESMKSETDDLSFLVVKLKEEIDLVRSQNLELLAEADKLKAEKARFEAEWELLDEKKEELRKEAECIAEEKRAVSDFIKDERKNLRQEKDRMRQQYNKDLKSLAHEREEFMKKVACDHDQWLNKMQLEREYFLQDIEMQKKELENLFEKRHEEVESYLKEREKAFEQEKNNELQSINAFKEKVAKDVEQVAFEMKKLHAERTEINLDRERRNREWDELNNCIEELKIQRDKLQKQRELLHADRIEIHAQTEELKKLEDLKIVSDDIAFTEILKSDMESNQQKISARKNLKKQTLTQGDELNPHKEVNANHFSNGLGTPSVQKPVVSPSSTVQYSWIKRCTELIFRHSPEKSLIENEDTPLVSDGCNDSGGRTHLMNDKPLGKISDRQPMRLSFGEPKVIVEVPLAAEDSEIKEDVNGKTAPSFLDQHHLGRRKRGSEKSSNSVGEPHVDQRQKKKLRPEEHATENCAISTQSDVSGVHETHVVMVDKVIHVSEVTCEKIDALNIPHQEKRDHLDNPTLEVDQGDLHGNVNDQSSFETIDKDILLCGSSVLGKTEETCKGNNGVTKLC